MKALVVYHSKTGTTRKMAQEIADHLKNNNIEVEVSSIKEVTAADIEKADKLYMGCWTSGLMILGQKPTPEWKSFVHSLPKWNNKEVTLFTTYKLATGSMLKKMKEELKYSGYQINKAAFKSKTGILTEEQKKMLSLSMN